MSRTARSVLVMSVLVSAGIALVVHRYQAAARAQPPSGLPLEYRVDQTVRERGVLESTDTVDLRCELPGASTILSIVPQGSRVQQGDLLVELDDAALRAQLAEAEIRVQQSKLGVVQRRAELQAVEVDGAAAVRLAEKALEAAEISRDKALSDGGELALQLTAARSELAVATARLASIETRLQESGDGGGPRSQEDLRLARIEARAAIEVAEAKRRFLETHERKAKTALLDLDVAEKQMRHARETHSTAKARRIAEAELAASESALAEDQRQLELVRQGLERCKIYAPRAGLVLHVTPAASRTARSNILEAGAQVRERQTLIQIPDLGKLRVRATVNESRIARVQVGQPARILCDALPEKTFQGKVLQVSKAPEPSSWWSGDVREYAVLVSLDKPDAMLRIGLTALVEIDTGE